MSFTLKLIWLKFGHWKGNDSMTEKEYEMVKNAMLKMIDKYRSEDPDRAIEAVKALAELEKAHNLSLIVDDNGTLDIKVYRY